MSVGGVGRWLLRCALIGALLSAATWADDPSREIEARALLAEGEKLIEMAYPEKAVPIFDRVKTQFPGTEAALFACLRRDAESRLRDSEAAKVLGGHLATARGDQQAAVAYLELARYYRKTGGLSEAVSALQAVALAREDRPDQAVELLDSCGAGAREDLRRAKARIALCSLEAAAAKGQVSAEALFVLGLVVPLRGSAKESLSDFEAEIIDRAIGVVREVIGKSGDAAEAATWARWIGTTYERMGRYRDAISVFERMRSSSSAPAEIRAEAAYRCGLCYHAVADHSSARMCMDEVVRLYPASLWAKKARGMLYVWKTYDTEPQVR